MNLSLMSLDEDKQKLIGNSNVSLSMGELERIRKISLAHNVDLRINNNIFKDNNDTKEDMFGFYMNLRDFCDSLKFSPLLKVDNFSVVNSPKEWVNSNILSPEDYENLYKSFENVFKDYPIVRNPLTFGFVEYSMIMLDTPIILNYNHRGMMAQKASMGLVNNIKLLSNGNLSLSWNKDDDTKVIRFFDGKETV